MKNIIIAFIAFITFLLFACGDATVPRPYGYFRVNLPKHSYKTIDTPGLPYKFDVASNARIIGHSAIGEKFWIDINYPDLNANIYCSYKPVNNNLSNLIEDTRKIVYKHSIKADGISEQVFDKPGNKVHGILYDLKGNTASSVQFVLTDSAHNFFRGALYFNNVPNKDSIAPMSTYIREDIIRIMESFEWK